jgi:hypothetical protein
MGKMTYALSSLCTAARTCCLQQGIGQWLSNCKPATAFRVHFKYHVPLLLLLLLLQDDDADVSTGHWHMVRQALVAAAAETVKAGRGTTAAATGGPSLQLLAGGIAAAVSLVAAAGRRTRRLLRDLPSPVEACVAPQPLNSTASAAPTIPQPSASKIPCFSFRPVETRPACHTSQVCH